MSIQNNKPVDGVETEVPADIETTAPATPATSADSASASTAPATRLVGDTRQT